jgi:hypothetical protein
MSLVNVSLESSALVTLLWTSFQQSIITEPIMHVLDLLLCGKAHLQVYWRLNHESRLNKHIAKAIDVLKTGSCMRGTAVNNETSVQKVS